MKNNKLLSIAISISLILIAISISYYFLKILPDQNKSELELSQQKMLNELEERCTELGQNKYSMEKEDEEAAGNGSYLLPNYSYNKSLDACLYRGIFVGDKYRSKYIINLDTNETLFESDYYDNEHFTGLTDIEFSEKESEVMK